MPLRSIWIIEDEPPALRRLQQLLGRLCPTAAITFTADTVSDTLAALRTQPAPDLILSDIHLADGLSFQIWEQHAPPCPIVFTTAYDQYSIRAFKVNSIDYLLKPIEDSELGGALDKFEQLHAPAPDLSALAAALQRREPVYRQRLVVQHRQEYVSLRVAEVCQFYSEDSLTFAHTRDRQRYLIDKTLQQLEAELDPAAWFRINRGQLVHIDAVRRAQPHFNHRLVVELQPAVEGPTNTVSRQRVGDFLAWLGR